MQTPAYKHFRRIASQQAAAASTPGTVQKGEQHELMSAALYEARQALHGIKSIEGKITKKRELLPQFDPYLEGVLAADKGAQDDVLLYCMVWHFDVGNLSSGLQLARYALKHKLQTPDKYSRDTASLVTESVADEVLRQLKAAESAPEGTPPPAFTGLLLETYELTATADMHDQIRAKLHKARGYAYRAEGNLELALQQLRRAVELNANVGVKKDIETLERTLKNQSGANDS